MLSDLNSYEEFYLAELGTSNTSSPAYDLQDVVIVVNHNSESLIDQNAAPIAQANTIITDEDSSTTYNLIAENSSDNAGKDSDPDGDELTITEFTIGNDTYTFNGQSSKSVTFPSGALLTVYENGDINYDPNDQFESLTPGQTASNPDSFSYTVSDPEGATGTAIATVDITGVTDNPFANDDEATTKENQAIEINILNNDEDSDTGKEDLTITQINEWPVGFYR